MNADTSAPIPESRFYVIGGTVPLESASYIERAADRELLDTLLADEYCYVLNARQMGKSSLSWRQVQEVEVGVAPEVGVEGDEPQSG